MYLYLDKTGPKMVISVAVSDLSKLTFIVYSKVLHFVSLTLVKTLKCVNKHIFFVLDRFFNLFFIANRH